MKFTYFFLHIFTITVPLLRSFEPRIRYVSKWKYFAQANLITALFFLIWDYFKTLNGVWSFNDNYIIGLKFCGLPIEEYLFFITVPFACTFIYEVLWLFTPQQFLPAKTKWILVALGVVLLAISPLYFSKAYTFSVLSLGGIALIILTNVFEYIKLEKIVMAYLVSIIPMFIVNGVLTALPVVIYNNDENLGIRLGTIPVEDFLYCAIMLFMNIGLYEFFKTRQLSKQPNIPTNTINKTITSTI